MRKQPSAGHGPGTVHRSTPHIQAFVLGYLECWGGEMEHKMKTLKMPMGSFSWSDCVSRISNFKYEEKKTHRGSPPCSLVSSRNMRPALELQRASSFLPICHAVSPPPFAATCPFRLSNPRSQQLTARRRRRPPCRHSARGCVALLAVASCVALRCVALRWEHNIHLLSSSCFD